MCEDFKCNGPIVFSQRGGRLKSLICTYASPPLSPLTLPHSCLLSLVSPPPLIPPPPLLPPRILSSTLVAGVFPWGDGWSVSYNRCHVISWWIRAVGNPCQGAWVGRWPAATPPLPGLLEPLRKGHRDQWERGGAVIAWPSHVGPTYTHCELDSWRRSTISLDVTWTVSFSSY